MADYVMTRLTIVGPEKDLLAFKKRHLRRKKVDFNTIIPMPPDLMVDSDSASETGFHALWGDWQQVARYWTFKEQALKLGYTFPVQSREQLIASINATGIPEFYFRPAQRYKANKDRYGYFTWYDWASEKWGTKTNAENTSIVVTPGTLQVTFLTAWDYPAPVVAALSKEHPTLIFSVAFVDEAETFSATLEVVNGVTRNEKNAPPGKLLKEWAK